QEWLCHLAGGRETAKNGCPTGKGVAVLRRKDARLPDTNRRDSTKREKARRYVYIWLGARRTAKNGCPTGNGVAVLRRKDAGLPDTNRRDSHKTGESPGTSGWALGGQPRMAVLPDLKGDLAGKLDDSGARAEIELRAQWCL